MQDSRQPNTTDPGGLERKPWTTLILLAAASIAAMSGVGEEAADWHRAC